MPPFRHDAGEVNNHISLHLHLAKGDRRRHFWIRPLDYRLRWWQGQTRFDGRTHWQIMTDELHEIIAFRIQCEAEVAELLKDGWVKIAATQLGSPRSARIPAPVQHLKHRGRAVESDAGGRPHAGARFFTQPAPGPWQSSE
jgi:hypothetical protein